MEAIREYSNNLEGMYTYATEEADFMNQLLASYDHLGAGSSSNTAGGDEQGLYWHNHLSHISQTDSFCFSQESSSYHIGNGGYYAMVLPSVGENQNESMDFAIEKNKRARVNRKSEKSTKDNNGGEEREGEKLKKRKNVALMSRQNSCTTFCSKEESICADEDGGGEEEEDRINAFKALNLNGKCRASRGAAINPQSLYTRKRRERINERLRILRNLVPNGTKVDISTMLEETVHYVKFLQHQIKLLSSDDLWMYAPIAINGMDLGLNSPR